MGSCFALRFTRNSTRNLRAHPFFIMSWYQKIVGFFSKDAAERRRFINTFNASAFNSFTTLSVDALFQAEVCEGNVDYKHEYSAPRSVSGFIVKVISGVDVPYEDVLLIGRIILENKALVRRMFVLHWDTLYIRDERNGRYGQWRIRDFVDFGGILPNF